MPVQPPQVITEPFGKNAPAANINLPIPTTTAVNGAASFDQGFPGVTMEPLASGGIQPAGQDVNGILYMISSHCAALQAGQPYLYSSAVATAIGGYALGVVLGMSDGTGLWFNTVANNSSNPDTGGAGWVPLYRYGSTSIAVSSGTVTLSAAQSKSPVIVFTGTLTGNVQVVFPENQQSWLIVNATTGNFTLSCGTAVGTGVAVVQGGYAQPTGVYCDNTGHMWTEYAPPTVVPNSVGPVANTLVMRSNAGYVYATYLNQNSSSSENPAIGSFFVENTAKDGFLRKVTKASVIAQLFSQSFSNPGYVTLPNGLIIQWTSVYMGDLPDPGSGAKSATAYFPITFPNNILGISTSSNDSNNNLGSYAWNTIGFSRSYVSFGAHEVIQGIVQAITMYAVAFGY